MDGPTAALTERREADGSFPETFARRADCHGTEGVGDRGPHMPRLDVLGPAHLAIARRGHRDGRRASGHMRHAASEPAEAAFLAMAGGLGAVTVGPPGPHPDPGLADQGERRARLGTRDDPACTACHGRPAPARDAFPILSGQHEGCLAAQFRPWRDADRGGGRHARCMHASARELSHEEVGALPACHASLPPSRPNPGRRRGDGAPRPRAGRRRPGRVAPQRGEEPTASPATLSIGRPDDGPGPSTGRRRGVSA